jgi:hypothetical protein
MGGDGSVTTRMRVVGWQVQPVIMADDGDNLIPINVDMVMIPAAQWEDFKAGGDSEALRQVREQIEKPTD